MIQNSEFGIVHLDDLEVLTTGTAVVGAFTKSYLGEQGRRHVFADIEKGAWPLKPGWREARYAVVSANNGGDRLGVVAEYADGTFIMLNQYAAKTGKSRLKELNGLTAQYLAAEAQTPIKRELWGWEEVTPGAVIREPFTSRDNITGLWAKNVAVIDPDKCNVCNQCGIWCPEDAIKFNPLTGKMDLVDYDYCKGCGICDFVCPPEQKAIRMIDEHLVKGASGNAFRNSLMRRLEVNGDYVRGEVDAIARLPADEYTIIYPERSGKHTLTGEHLLQVLHTPADADPNRRPFLYTYASTDGRQWRKIIRPLTNILVYGMSEHDRELAAGLQAEGFRVLALPAAGERADNKAQAAFEKAGVRINSGATLETVINEPGRAIDAVVTAHYGSITTAQEKLIMEKVGVLRAPYLPTHVRDDNLENIISRVEAKLPEPTVGKDEKLLALIMDKEGDIASGHRLCTGCVIGTAFNLIVRTMKEMDPELSAVHAGATGCSEVATTIYPETSWPSYLHTTFGGVAANLEGLNAAYRYLHKRGLLKKKIKFFAWAGDGGTYDIGLQALSGFLERGLATDSVYVCYDNGAYMNTGIQRSSATPMGSATSTSPVGKVVHGKPQFRKDLEHLAAAHRGVYVGRVSPSHQIDFINKVKKAIQHDGPALIVCYSNCTTGHRTDTHLTAEQSRLAVECGYWPLFEIEDGEVRLSQPPPSVYNPRVSGENKVKLIDWLKTEGRFAMHFDRNGDFISREHAMEFREAERRLLADWRQLQAEDRLTRRKDKLMDALLDYLKAHNAKRLQEVTAASHPFGLGEYTRAYLDDLSWLDEEGQPKPFLKRVLRNVRMRIDPDDYKAKDPDLEDKLYALFKEEYETLTRDIQALRQEQLAKQAAKSRAREAVAAASNTKLKMAETEKQKNRAIIGARPVAGRIFARAGDGGVTAAKLFVSLLKEIGLFGKAAPDYGPERRGAPVGTNFVISGKELRTQASFEQLAISVAINPNDEGWPVAQWRDAVVPGGVIIMNTKLTADVARKQYLVPDAVTVVTVDATEQRKSRKVPETVTLLSGVLKTLAAGGVAVPEDYLGEKFRKILTKEFADKANAEKIVQANLDAFWDAYHAAQVSPAGGSRAVNRDAVAIQGFEQSPPEQLMTGSEAVAEVWRQINPGVFAMFPITPSTEVGQTFSQFWADGQVDTEFIHTESEHSSFMIIIAAAVAGVRAVTSTASQGMLLGKEGGPLAATLRLPVVVNVGAREVNAPLNIHAGHVDFYQFRDDGWMHFLARNAQEAYDFAVIAQKTAERAMLPAFINQDGFIVTHNKDMLNTLTDEQVKNFVGEYDPPFSILKTGGTFNPVALQDYYSEHARTMSESQKRLPGILDEVFAEFAALTGRRYRRVHNYHVEDAEVVVVTMGSTEGTALDAVDELRAEGVKAGLLALKVFRPFPAEEIRKALVNAGTVIVMDRANSQGAELTPLALEVQSATRRRVLALEYGRGGRNTPLQLVKDIYRLGLVLNSKVDGKMAQRLLRHPNAELAALLGELRALEGDRFVDGFIEHIVNGRLIDAYGPREHIDVRETTRRRDIKLQVIKEVTRRGRIMAVENVDTESPTVVRASVN
jgi:pyruvate ferredoxin oxidoreductase alpha subunit